MNPVTAHKTPKASSDSRKQTPFFKGEPSNIQLSENPETKPISFFRSAQASGIQPVLGLGQTIQRDLAIDPPHPDAEFEPLTPQEIEDAIRFNRGRYDEDNIRMLQDLVGAEVTGTMNAETVELIAQYQADSDLTPDGKAGADTFALLTEEMGAEDLSDEDCLTLFHVSNPRIPMELTVAGPGRANIFSRFNVEARFSPHCHCEEFEYRQFISGNVDRTRAGVTENLNALFAVPGGGIPASPTWREDGNIHDPHNGRYGHRGSGHHRVNNTYQDQSGTVDMEHGCVFKAFDVPGLFEFNDVSGDVYRFDIRFYGEIQRNGSSIQRKFWSVRDTVTMP